MQNIFLEIDSSLRENAVQHGRKLVKENAVAVVTLAGGSGSRLAYDGPKGTFVLETPRRKASLFERQAEKIGTLPWIIMVSSANKDKTIKHLQETVLKKREYIILIEQGNIEALSFDNKPLYDNNKQVILVPDGNGSVFAALQKKHFLYLTNSSIKTESISPIEYLSEKGVKYINIISIDNVLVNIADPAAVGWIYMNGLDIVSSAVPIPKDAKMGVFIEEKGTFRICEYTDTPDKKPLTNNGAILGNIANHIASIGFLRRIDSFYLPYHDAKKKIPHAGDPSPTSPNAIKKEIFIFDGFNISNKHGVIECLPSAYHGLKNREGPTESISSCIKALAEE